MAMKLQNLNHMRVLRLMARACSAEELFEPLQKLRTIVEERREEERRLQERYSLQNERIKRLIALLQADNIQPAELVQRQVCKGRGSVVKGRKVRPAKYRFIDRRGMTKTWTGQGRMPDIMASALQQGKSLKDFLI